VQAGRQRCACNQVRIANQQSFSPVLVFAFLTLLGLLLLLLHLLVLLLL
jgi:hypothetical protein